MAIFRYMRLRDIFVLELRKMNVERIGTRLKKVMSSLDPITRIAVYVANGKAEVCRSDGGLQHSFTLDGRFVNLPPHAYVGKCQSEILLSRDNLTAYPFPYVVVDCRFFHQHSEKERQKIKLQIKQTLGVVRNYMWDKKLIVTYRDFGFGVFYPSTEDFLRDKGVERVVLLDPSGEELYSKTNAKCFIIGGIVDKSGLKKGYTSIIGKALENEGFDVDPRRIELKGDVIGVPDRINHIAEILLRVELDGMDVESAIKAVQPPLVAKWRLRKELHNKTLRVCAKKRVFRVVARDEFDSFKDWLNIRKQDFYEVCKEQGFFVVSDRALQRIKAGEWDEKRRCFKLSG